MEARVSKRYAKALFELAREKNLLAETEESLRKVQDVYEATEEFQTLLESPVIQASEKRKVADQLFKEKIHPLAFQFISLLFEKNREVLLPQVISGFLVLLDEARGIIRGQLYTAHSFTDPQLEQLVKKMNTITGKNVIFEQRVDSGLLGGFVIRMNDKIIDSSLKNQLAKMRENMVSGE